VSRYVGWIASTINPLVATDFSYVPFITFIEADEPPPPPPPPPPSPLVNGNFEQGPGVGWTEDSSNDFPLIVNDFEDNTLTPHSGDWAVWLGGGSNEVATLSQSAAVPAAAPFLSYYYVIGSTDFCGYDRATVSVNGTPLEQYNLCSSTNTSDWMRDSLDLSAYAGQNVTIEFAILLDSSFNSNFFLDDVAFTTSRATAEEAPAAPAAPGLRYDLPRE